MSAKAGGVDWSSFSDENENVGNRFINGIAPSITFSYPLCQLPYNHRLRTNMRKPPEGKFRKSETEYWRLSSQVLGQIIIQDTSPNGMHSWKTDYE